MLFGACVSSSSFFSFSYHTRWLLLLPSDLGFFFSFSFLTRFSDTGKKKKATPSDRYGAHKQCEKYWVMASEWWYQTSRVFWVMEIEWLKKGIQTPPKCLTIPEPIGLLNCILLERPGEYRGLSFERITEWVISLDMPTYQPHSCLPGRIVLFFHAI